MKTNIPGRRTFCFSSCSANVVLFRRLPSFRVNNEWPAPLRMPAHPEIDLPDAMSASRRRLIWPRPRRARVRSDTARRRPGTWSVDLAGNAVDRVARETDQPRCDDVTHIVHSPPSGRPRRVHCRCFRPSVATILVYNHEAYWPPCNASLTAFPPDENRMSDVAACRHQRRKQTDIRAEETETERQREIKKNLSEP